MTGKDRYRQVFSQLHASAHIRWEDMETMKYKAKYSRRLLVLAAALALLAAVSTAAAATGFFGLRGLLLGRREVRLPLEPGESVQGTQMADTLSLAGYAGTPEYQATTEWEAYLASLDLDAILDEVGNDIFADGAYAHYQVYTREMADALEAIAAQYHLKLHRGIVDLFTNQDLYDRVGGDFLGDNRAGSAYMYEDGTFKFDGEIELEGYGLLDYQFMRCVRGSFTDVTLSIGDPAQYTEWAYTTACGVPVALALGPTRSLLIADLPDCFVTVNVLAGTDTPMDGIFSTGPVTAEVLERFADSFDFNLLSPALVPDMTQSQRTGLPDPEQFYHGTGIGLAEAQAFFAEFVRLAEADDRQGVAELLFYPAAVELELGGETITVDSPEEFLPYYDAIFTPALWEDIYHNMYTNDRSDLYYRDGMVGAAGGGVWFALTPDGRIGIMTIQNGMGPSIRPAGGPGVTGSP